MRDFKYEFQTNTIYQDEYFAGLKALRDDFISNGDNINVVKINTIGIRCREYLEKIKKF